MMFAFHNLRCWRQPEEVWINKPPEENELTLELTLMQAA
jgi:putative transposase